MQLAWDIRWQRREPEACQLGAGIKDYSMPNLKCEIFEEICEVKQEQGRPLTHEEVATVFRKSSGQTGDCSRQVALSDYSIDSCLLDERIEHCGQ